MYFNINKLEASMNWILILFHKNKIRKSFTEKTEHINLFLVNLFFRLIILNTNKFVLYFILLTKFTNLKAKLFFIYKNSLRLCCCV